MDSLINENNPINPHPTEPLLEAILEQTAKNNNEPLLESILEQTAKNNPEGLLEANLEQGVKNTDKIITAIKEIPIPELKVPETKIDMSDTNKLLNQLIEEQKKECKISVKLNIL